LPMKAARFLFILVFFISLASGCNGDDKALLPESQAQAPEFTLSDISGNRVSLSDYRGKKAVLLIFWTTWCPYCRVALKSLKEDRRSFEDMGIEMLAINAGESSQKANSFAQRLGLDFKVLLDPGTVVSDNYDVLGVPTYFVITKGGRIAFSGNRLLKARLSELVLE